MKTPILILDEMIEEYKLENDDVLRYGMNVLKKAKERIQSLDNISKETGWISVEDKEPEKFTDVLLFPGIEIGYMSNNGFWIYNNGDYTEGGYGNDYKAEGITHWIPLPIPPNH